MLTELGGGIIEADRNANGRNFADRMELAFKGIDKRTFEYTFKMMPRSEVEADEIRKIIAMLNFICYQK